MTGEERDGHIVTHVVMATLLAGTTAATLLIAVPDLFNMHTDASSTGAALLGVGALCTAYIGGRFIWRSYNSTGEEE